MELLRDLELIGSLAPSHQTVNTESENVQISPELRQLFWENPSPNYRGEP